MLTADEEAGGDLGARWLCEQHPDKVRSDFVVNEGGGAAIEFDGRRLYTLSVGEKGIFRMRLRHAGRAGHASLPRIGDNALLKLAAPWSRLTEQPPPEPTARDSRSSRRCSARRSRGPTGMRAGARAAARRRSRCSPTSWPSRC